MLRLRLIHPENGSIESQLKFYDIILKDVLGIGDSEHMLFFKSEFYLFLINVRL